MSIVTPYAPRALRARAGRARPLRLLLYALAALLPDAAHAQAGTITGVIVDGAYGGGLIGANVSVYAAGAPTLLGGSAADLDGRYRVASVPAGTYDVAFSFTGYATQRVTGVRVAPGATVTLDVTLAEAVQELGGGQEVVVTADAILDNDAALLRLRQRAEAVSDAIGAREISRSGSASAADAMERVTGASVQGGRYVFVRGLGDRYANTQLNGAELPTADPDRRAVQFDLFPSSFLENIVTLKTFTPDRPGSFSGGLVDITTRSFPEAFSVTASASLGLTTEATPGGAFLSDPVGGVGFFASDSRRDLPALLEGLGPADFRQPIEVQFDRAGAERLEALSEAFTATPAPRASEAVPNGSFGLSVGNRVRLLGHPLGFIVGVTYDRGVSYYQGGRTGRYTAILEDGVYTPVQRFALTDSRGTEEVNVGALANVTYRLGTRNEVTLNTLFTRSAEAQARFLIGTAPTLSFEGDSTTLLTDRVVSYVERQLASGQLRGRHQFPRLFGTELEWRGAYARTNLDEPDLRYFANLVDTLDGAPRYYIGNFRGPEHYFRALDEDLASLGADVAVPFRQWGGLAARLKFGGLYQQSARAFRERRFELRLNTRLPLNGNGAEDVEAFFDPANVGIISADTLADGRVRYNFGHFIQERANLANQYDGDLEVGAGYAMVELPLTSRFRFIGGARYETTVLGVTSQAPDTTSETGFLGGTIRENDLLPSVNLVYALRDDMNLRAAATRTLARPTFREIAPYASFDFSQDGFLIGNPALERTLIQNLDLRWEWFGDAGEILAVSGYYKDFENPIERVIIDVNGQTQYRNVGTAEVAGLELEARRRLGVLSPALADFALGANLTLIRSTIAIDSTELRERRALNPDAADHRQLQGQSPYVLNLDLAYDDAGSGTSAGLYFNVFGRRLARVGTAGSPDVFEVPSPQLDLVATQRFLGAWSLRLSAKNLLDAPFREEYDFGRADNPVYQEYNRGRSFSVGLSFSPRFDRGGPADAPIPAPGAVPLGAATGTGE